MPDSSNPKKENKPVNTQRQSGTTRVQNSEGPTNFSNRNMPSVRIANIRESERSSIVRPLEPPKPKDGK